MSCASKKGGGGGVTNYYCNMQSSPHSPAARCFHMDYTAARCCQNPRCWSFHWSCPCCTQRCSSARIDNWQCCHCSNRNFPTSQMKNRSFQMKNRNFQMKSRSCRCFPRCSSGRACSWQCCRSGSCRWCRSRRIQTAPTRLGSCPQLESTHCLCRSPLAGSFPSRTQRSTGRCAEEVLSKPGSSKHGLTGWTCTSILIDFFTIFIIVTIITIVTIVIVIIKSWLGETGWYFGSASKSNQAESKSCLHPSFIGYHLLKEHISPCHPYHPAGGIKTQYMDHPWKVQAIATFHYKCISLSILTFTIIIICFQWKLHVSGVDVLNTKHRKNSLLLLCDFYLTLRCLSRHGDLEST